MVKKIDTECRENDDGITCPQCGAVLERGYGFASKYGLGSYSYCEEHGFYDYIADES